MKVRPIFTYSFSKGSLYIPLTSHCNSLTLPQTRGPSFVMNAAVVAALCRVRTAEGVQQLEPWCKYLDMQDSDVVLPKPIAEKVEVLEADDPETTRPTVLELMQEIHHHCETDTDLNKFVIAGEGEPTLRPRSLQSLVQAIKEERKGAQVRLVTNGLNASAQDLADMGIGSMSIALMTHDGDQYKELMEPVANGHGAVMQLVREAKELLTTEVTAVEGPCIDREKTEELAVTLGVPLRWRPYFE